MKNKAGISLLFFLTLLQYGSSQPNLRFEKIGIKDGLSNEKVNCIFQDSKGFIWVGTDFGLNRYDGIDCKTWYHDEKNSHSLVNNSVLSVAEDQSHYLWIATQEGVSRFDPLTEVFQNYSSKGTGNFQFSKENCYSYVDKNNTVWIGSNKGASWFDEKENRFRDVPMELTRPGVNRNLFATSVLHDSKKRLWVSTSYGIKRISPDRRSSASFHLPEPGLEKLGENACTHIVEDRNGNIFAGTWNAGLLYFDEKEQRFRNRKLSSDNAQNLIYQILPFTENNIDFLWLGTNAGLLKVRTEEIIKNKPVLSITEYKPDKINVESLSHETIYALLADRSGITWIGTASGICKLDPLQQQFQTFYLSPDRSFNEEMITLAESFDQPGDVIISSSNSFFKMDSRNDNFMSVSSALENITCIEKGKAYYWCGSFNGLWQCDRNLKLVKKWLTTGFTGPAGSARIKSVLEDHEGKIWCGLWRGGLITIDPVSGATEKFLMDTLSGYDLRPFIIAAIIEDRKQNIWLASNNGLFRYDRSTKTFRQFLANQPGINANINALECITESRDGKIWIGSRQGLRYYEYPGDRMIQVEFPDPAVNDFISGIIEDAHQKLWLATTNGLLQYDPSTRQLKKYNAVNHLPVNNLSLLFEKDQVGNIYIGSPGAVTIFNPADLKKNETANPPIITAITIDNESMPLTRAFFRLKFNQSIRVDFVALNYSHASANQYAYMLNGIDREWKPLGTSRTIYFANLPQGKYTLKIRAANSDGLWYETSTDLNFRVTPPFWKTWWFAGILVLVVTITAWAFYRNRLQRAVEMERLRTRIATDLHDDIGATLSSISMYSDVVKSQVKERLPHLEPVLEKMGENSREMVNNMSDIVWAINPGNDDGQKLVQRMESYARDICSVKNVQLHFSGDENLNELKMPLEHRKNIYLIFKEALNNALKYAAAEKISIVAEKRGNELFLQVKDNGKGFNTDLIGNGNGLKNLEARAAEIGGLLRIRSVPGEGTGIELTCKV